MQLVYEALLRAQQLPSHSVQLVRREAGGNFNFTLNESLLAYRTTKSGGGDTGKYLLAEILYQYFLPLFLPRLPKNCA